MRSRCERGGERGCRWWSGARKDEPATAPAPSLSHNVVPAEAAFGSFSTFGLPSIFRLLTLRPTQCLVSGEPIWLHRRRVLPLPMRRQWFDQPSSPLEILPTRPSRFTSSVSSWRPFGTHKAMRRSARSLSSSLTSIGQKLGSILCVWLAALKGVPAVAALLRLVPPASRLLTQAPLCRLVVPSHPSDDPRGESRPDRKPTELAAGADGSTLVHRLPRSATVSAPSSSSRRANLPKRIMLCSALTARQTRTLTDLRTGRRQPSATTARRSIMCGPKWASGLPARAAPGLYADPPHAR